MPLFVVWLLPAAALMIPGNASAVFAQEGTGFNFTFDASPLSTDLWLNSCGTQAIQADWWGFNVNSYQLMSLYNLRQNDQGIDAGRMAAENSNVKFSHIDWGPMDFITGMVWGSVFTVLADHDESDNPYVIRLELSGGTNRSTIGALPSETKRAAGIALWDIAAGQFIPGSYRSNGGSDNYDVFDIQLQGLAGKELMLVGLDRTTETFGWFGLKSAFAPEGSVKLWDANKMHRVVKEWTFDAPGIAGWEGWYEVAGEDLRIGGGTKITDGFGNPVYTNFMRGDNDLGALFHYIDSQGFARGKGYVGAFFNDHWENAVGVLRSPTFKLDGDVIEFMVGGWRGDNPDWVAPLAKPDGFRGDELYTVGFDLMIKGLDLDHPELFILAMSSTSDVNSNDFIYDFWAIQDEWKGVEAYLRLRDDSAAAGFAWMAVDNIRMLQFGLTDDENDVPEPGTWAMLLLGVLGIFGFRRVRK